MDHAKVKILNFNKETTKSAPHYCNRCHTYFTHSRAYVHHLSTFKHSTPTPKLRVISRVVQPKQTKNQMASPHSEAPSLGDVNNVSFGETIRICVNNETCLQILLVKGFRIIGICKKDIKQCYICRRPVSEYAIAHKMNLATTSENKIHFSNNVYSAIAQKATPLAKTPAASAAIDQTLSFPKAVIGQNLPMPKAALCQKLPTPKATIGEKLPIPKTAIGEKLPIHKAAISQKVPIPKAAIGQKLPNPNAAIGKNLPCTNSAIGQNLPLRRAAIGKSLPDVVPASEKELRMEWQGGVGSFSIPPPAPFISQAHQFSPLTFGMNGASNLVMQRIMPDESEAECVLGF